MVVLKRFKVNQNKLCPAIKKAGRSLRDQSVTSGNDNTLSFRGWFKVISGTMYMLKVYKNWVFFFLLLFMASSCKAEVVVPDQPSDLTVVADIREDGSGLVHFTAKAVNAVRYSFVFGHASNETSTESADGKASTTYKASGGYSARVLAYSASNEVATITKKIRVTVASAPISYYNKYTQYGEPFAQTPATKDVVMYEVNLRAFSAAGDINGVISRLDSIRALGTNVIWLMPIHPIGQIKSVNSPYAVRNYKEVNPEFGNLESLRNLTTEAHKRGMAVVLDWVANHTSWDNPWIANKDWYTQVGGQIVSPVGTNWQDVADLNFDNLTMRSAMIDALKYWVYEANLDGYRFDAADYVPFSFWKQAIDSLQAIPHRRLVLLAEGERNDHFAAGFQMNYAWGFYAKLKDVFAGQPATALQTVHVAEYADIPPGKHKLRFTTNHDESAWDATPITLFHGKEGAFAASVIATYMGGVPLFYGSQEVGTPAKVPFFYKEAINWSLNLDLFSSYKTMMRFYGQSNALKEGVLNDYSTNDVVCFTRKAGTEEVLVLVNVRNRQVSFQLPAEFQHSSWKRAFTNENAALDTTLELNNFGCLIFKK